ncbi:glycosyltransferase family 4 protein [Streptomyces sp. NPDC056128]|uniref:glycosyltransferase family 4 protein n=1 Tax=Streptomyces sp. NPDC056128 TaxID=3345721 RepID=UPI0035DB45AB
MSSRRHGRTDRRHPPLGTAVCRTRVGGHLPRLIGCPAQARPTGPVRQHHPQRCGHPGSPPTPPHPQAAGHRAAPHRLGRPHGAVEAVDHLVRAVADPRLSTAVRLEIFGDSGSHQTELTRLANELAAPVRFLGYVDDLPQRLGGYDLLASAAVQEGFGRAVIDAAGVATPSLVPNAGASPELVLDGLTGMVYDPSDLVAGQAERSLVYARPLRRPVPDAGHGAAAAFPGSSAVSRRPPAEGVGYSRPRRRAHRRDRRCIRCGVRARQRLSGRPAAHPSGRLRLPTGQRARRRGDRARHARPRVLGRTRPDGHIRRRPHRLWLRDLPQRHRTRQRPVPPGHHRLCRHRPGHLLRHRPRHRRLRCISLVDDLLTRFQPYQHTPGVAELLDLADAHTPCCQKPFTILDRRAFTPSGTGT